MEPELHRNLLSDKSVKMPLWSLMDYLGISKGDAVNWLAGLRLGVGKRGKEEQERLNFLASKVIGLFPETTSVSQVAIAAGLGGGGKKVSLVKGPVPAVKDLKSGRIFPGEGADVPHASIAVKLNDMGIPFENMESGWMEGGKYSTDIKSAVSAKPWLLTADEYVASKEKTAGKVSEFEKGILRREHADLVKKAQEKGLAPPPSGGGLKK